MKKLVECRIRLGSIAEKFRHADVEFVELSLEDKKMLNDIGKILFSIWHILHVYDFSDENKKLEIRQKIADLNETLDETCRVISDEGLDFEKEYDKEEDNVGKGRPQLKKPSLSKDGGICLDGLE